jgi:hypothetical protein
MCERRLAERLRQQLVAEQGAGAFKGVDMLPYARTLLSVRFTESERAELEKAAKRDGIGLSEWARRVLLAEALRK